MNEEKFQELMDAIQVSKRDLQKDFTDHMSKLKSEILTGQESSSQEVVKKLNKRTFQFKRKGNEAQYTFNTTVEELIDAARKSLENWTPSKNTTKLLWRILVIFLKKVLRWSK